MELILRANTILGGYKPIVVEEEESPEEKREEGEIEQETVQTEDNGVILRGNNLPIMNLTKYNTDGKETKYLHIYHVVGKMNTNKKVTEDHIKETEFVFLMDLKTLISKTAIDPELTRVRNSMRKLSTRRGLIFVDDQIVILIDLRRRLLDILHFSHSGITKMTSEAKIFWWPNM